MKSYNLDIKRNTWENKKFTKDELVELSTYRLKKICNDYKIVNAFQYTYSREELIDIILKYRGENVSYLIDDEMEGGIERIQEALDANSMYKMKSRNQIKIPARIIVYEELGIKKVDLYKVTAENEIEESNVLLVNGNRNYVCGVFHLKKDKTTKNSYYLIANNKNLRLQGLTNKNYKFLFFNRNASEYLYKNYYNKGNLPPINMQYYEVPIIQFEIRNLEETKAVLCIDFGTSNTTAGVFLNDNYISTLCDNDLLNNRIDLNEINFVRFPYVDGDEEGFSKITPTSIYVSNCKEADNIKYRFGYEAKEQMKRNNYTGKGSVFQGIKRWINTYKRYEEVFDEYGNIAKVTRGEIISAYVDYVIKTAEHQFKCKFKKIYISSPVKLKEQFIKMFQDIVPDYEIESENVLDEGIAVLYNTIVNQISKGNYYNDEKYKALVIDCGGGTTDLSSCEFRIIRSDISFKVDMKTGFENGDTNFGGNNITYRIMQFMKIVFARYYQTNGERADIDELIPISNMDIYRRIDEFGVDKIYSTLEEYYEKAERIIPTRYRQFENRPGEEYQRVKNNFHFLWELAENMKKDFYSKTSILRNQFSLKKEIENEETDLKITLLNNWELSVFEDGVLVTTNILPDVVFNIAEIHKLIKGDIYDIIRKFLEKYYETGEMMEYSILKLTGQSCKIDIFKEALKEFVPGRSIEFKQKKTKDDMLDLKLSCLRGIIKHVNSKTLGNIEISIENEAPVIPYRLSSMDFIGSQKTIIESGEKLTDATGSISKPLSAREVKFYLKNNEGELQKEYVYENQSIDYKKVLVEDLLDEYPGKIRQEDTDTIQDDEVKYFAFTAEDKWGFYILPVCRMDEQLHVGKKRYYAFEDDLSNLNFFDGLK